MSTPPPPDSDSDSDDGLDASIFHERTASQESAIADFWRLFEGKSGPAPNPSAPPPRPHPDGDSDSDSSVVGAGRAVKSLRGRYAVHYDYVEALFGLLAWLLLVTALYQLGTYRGYKYVHLMRKVSHWLALTFVGPFFVVVGLWWWEVKREEGEMLDNAREKKRVLREIREATRRGKKNV